MGPVPKVPMHRGSVCPLPPGPLWVGLGQECPGSLVSRSPSSLVLGPARSCLFQEGPWWLGPPQPFLRLRPSLSPPSSVF